MTRVVDLTPHGGLNINNKHKMFLNENRAKVGEKSNEARRLTSDIQHTLE